MTGGKKKYKMMIAIIIIHRTDGNVFDVKIIQLYTSYVQTRRAQSAVGFRWTQRTFVIIIILYFEIIRNVRVENGINRETNSLRRRTQCYCNDFLYSAPRERGDGTDGFGDKRGKKGEMITNYVICGEPYFCHNVRC